MEGEEIYFKQKDEESKMRPEIKIQYRGENQAKGNLFLKVPRKRERKIPPLKTGRTESEGREKGEETN